MTFFAPIPQKVKGIIFDCDGVILDSKQSNQLFYNKVLEAFDLPHLTEEQATFVYMATVEQALNSIIPEHLHSQLEEVCTKKVNYHRDVFPLVKLEEGFYDFTLWLQSKNVRLGIHTNRSNAMRMVTEKFPFLYDFSPIMTVSDVKPKPHPEGIFTILSAWGMEKENVLFVGDSKNDQQAAAAASVAFVAYGSADLDATINVQSFKALQEIISPLV